MPCLKDLLFLKLEIDDAEEAKAWGRSLLRLLIGRGE